MIKMFFKIFKRAVKYFTLLFMFLLLALQFSAVYESLLPLLVKCTSVKVEKVFFPFYINFRSINLNNSKNVNVENCIIKISFKDLIKTNNHFISIHVDKISIKNIESELIQNKKNAEFDVVSNFNNIENVAINDFFGAFFYINFLNELNIQKIMLDDFEQQNNSLKIKYNQLINKFEINANLNNDTLDTKLLVAKNIIILDDLKIHQVKFDNKLIGFFQINNDLKIKGEFNLLISNLHNLGFSSLFFSKDGSLKISVDGDINNTNIKLKPVAVKKPWQDFAIGFSVKIPKKNFNDWLEWLQKFDLSFLLKLDDENSLSCNLCSDSNKVNGQLSFFLNNLHTISQWFGKKTHGNVRCFSKIENFNLLDYSGNLQTDLEFDKVIVENFAINHLQANFNIKDLMGGINVIGKKIMFMNKDFNIDLNLNIDLLKHLFNFKNFLVSDEKNIIKLEKPLALNEKQFLSDLFLSVNGHGKIKAENVIFKNQNNNWSGKITFSKVSASVLNIFLSDAVVKGFLDLVINIYGDNTFPYFKGKLDISDLNFFNQEDLKKTYKIPSLYLKTNFDCNSENLQWNLFCEDKEYVFFQSKGILAFLQDYQFESLKATFEGKFKINLINAILGIDDKIYGDLTTKLKIEGFKDQPPKIFGSIELARGLYENTDVGTLFKDITITAQANGNLIKITSLKGYDGVGEDGVSGFVKGDGVITFDDILKPKINLVLNLKDTQIADGNSFKGFATGVLNLIGYFNELKINGRVDLFPAYLKLEEASDKKIAKLKIVNKTKIPKKNKIKKVKHYDIVPLDIEVNMPKKFFIEGFGLYSEWFGFMKIQDSIMNPQMIGQINLVKGHIDFLGRKLNITTGTIIYDDKFFNDPLLKIIAEKETANKELLYLKITERGDNPDVNFSSSPSYPPEEVLALILFDKKLSEISVMQSVQLATALASVQGNKGLNFIDTIKGFLGLDLFEIKEYSKNDSYSQEGKSQVVSLGKEIAKNVVVSVEKGSGSDTSKINVSTSIMNNVVVDASVGSNRNSGVGLNWIKRY
jgi:hypothetical protein